MVNLKETGEGSSEFSLFTAAEMLNPENQHLLEQIVQLDEQRYVQKDADPFLITGTPAISTHIAILQHQGEVRGAAALILRENSTQSAILRSTIEKLEDKYPGCSTLLQEQARMLVIANLVSRYPGSAAAIIRQAWEQLSPKILVGYTRNAKFVKALATALPKNDFSIHLGGVPINSGEPISPFAHCYESAVTAWLASNCPKLEGTASIPLGEGEYPPLAVIYPEPLRSQFTLGQGKVVDGLISQASELQAGYTDRQISITFGFSAIHKSIDEIILGNANG